MKTPKILIVLLILLVAAVVAFLLPRCGKLAEKPIVINYETCKLAGGTILETHPPQCQYEGKKYTEDIGNELDLYDLITIANPRPNQKISSPLEIRGAARGSWYFEASFPIKLIDEKGNTIAQTHGEAQGDWMTKDFVPYKATLAFKTNSTKGTLILMKDNPSGDPKNDKQLKVPVVFK